MNIRNLKSFLDRGNQRHKFDRIMLKVGDRLEPMDRIEYKNGQSIFCAFEAAKKDKFCPRFVAIDEEVK